MPASYNMVFSFLTPSLKPASSSTAHTMTCTSTKDENTTKQSEGAQSITRLFVLSTIFTTMFVSSAKPLSLPQTIPAPRLESDDSRSTWHSIFNWTFWMLIITPRPDVRRINKHRRRPSTTKTKVGLLARLVRVFSIVREQSSAIVKGAFDILQSPFASKSKPQPPILPLHVSPVTQVDTCLESPAIPSLAIHNAPSASESTLRTPPRAVSPANRASTPDLLASPKTSPTTAHFLATLADLETRMNNHEFYDLERELENMDSQMSRLFDFPWAIPKAISPISTFTPSPPPSPAPMILPRAPPPARRDGKTIQILPMICEVSENSADLGCVPPYDPRRWSIISFQPLWGPRAQVGTMY
ncbi:unnamed protein product [Rhizoctonia solani]|uniref:Uncharacterized protein n=1 Tax=Rhizoctonia solani TaxID=456999 RepID=A0A8H3A430_9AGAM|nr:unnamed protein product [Rhizoctonia solani]